MSWARAYPRSAAVVGLTLAVPLVILLYVVVDFLLLRQGYQEEIDRLQPRIARMAGLVESQEQLRVSVGRLSSQVLNLVYPPTEDSAVISAALQKDVRQIMTDAGLTVSNSRILPVIQEDRFDRIGLSLVVTGGLDSLDAALAALTAYTPLLLIDSLDIKPRRMSRARDKNGQQVVTASFQLLTLRAI